MTGIMLPYPHGFDDDPSLQYVIYDRDFLHIFNLGAKQGNAVGVARCVKYETGRIPPMKRVSFALDA